MPIEDRNLEPGTVLTARYKGETHTAEVVQTEDGLRFKTADGELFSSPSSAAKHVMGGIAANGWRFWSLEATEKPKREPKAKKEPKTKKEPAAKKPAKATKKPKGKAMRAKATDVASYGCGACGATFGSQKAAINHTLTHTA